MTKRYHPAREPSLRETLRHDLARAASESGWPEVSWTVRSLIAAGMVAVCVMMTAMSATATVKRNEAAREAQVVLADEAKLVAEFADYLAAETQNARAALDGPSLKPAVLAVDFATEDAPIADLVEFDFAELPRAEAAGRERKCLAEAIYYEARSESRVGQLAVADVILNRVKSPVYPDSICGVVYQGSQRRTGCQFSFTCDGSMRARVNPRKMRDADLLAGAILAGVRVPVSRSATHYHADYVSPPWADRLTPTAVIGAHKFYRFPSRSIQAAAPTAM